MKVFKTMGLVLLCVSGPIVGIWALKSGFFGESLGFVPFLLFLLCPISHMFMMKFMCKDDNETKNAETGSCHNVVKKRDEGHENAETYTR